MRSSPQRELHAAAEDFEEHSVIPSKHLVRGSLRQLHLPATRSADHLLAAGSQRGHNSSRDLHRHARHWGAASEVRGSGRER